jgi:cytochrome d ubiquinol oxidase subunit II
MFSFIQDPYLLPIIFGFLLAVSMFLYAILDGYNLGAGILMLKADSQEKDSIFKSIDPFWDANETWLVLLIGLVLVAFPKALQGLFSNIYFPISIMLLGILGRGVSFGFNGKIEKKYQKYLDYSFIFSSFLISFIQGYIVGNYICQFKNDIYSMVYSCLFGFFVVSCYCLIGSSWLIIKMSENLKIKSIHWGKKSLLITVILFLSIIFFVPYINNYFFNNLLNIKGIFFIGIFIFSIIYHYYFLNNFENKKQPSWFSYIFSVITFAMIICLLTFGCYPYIVPNQITIWQAASDTESLSIILIGAIIFLPIIIGYTIYSHKVFWDKVDNNK